ncbi:MAG: PLP-dependent cysteine synthase family protein [bacterium]|jgi:cysteine synthase A
MKKLQDNILACAAETPLVRLGRIAPLGAGQVLAKLELMNVSGSAKIRSALAMVEAAEAAGLLRPGAIIAEASSGNGGIGMAAVGAVKGYKVIVVMPDNASVERQQLIRAYGAEVVLTPREERVAGAIAKVAEIKAANPDTFTPESMGNPANPDSHFRTTGREILRQYPGRIDVFVAGAGSGGTLTGVARALKVAHPAMKVYVANPDPGTSVVAGVGRYGAGSSFPAVFERDLLDGFIDVPDEDTIAMTKALAQKEGILAGPSSGMVVSAAARLAAEMGPGSTVVTILMDTGERYLSTGLFD